MLVLREIIKRYTCPKSPTVVLYQSNLSLLCPDLSPFLSQVVKLCNECLEKQEHVLADTNLHRLRVLGVASEVLSYMKHFSEAATLVHKMVDGYM